jgi:choline-sulfatase
MANSTITEDDVRRARRAYYGNCTYVDEWTGKILDTVQALGLADDTVTLVTADHGDMIGEHGLWYKMNFFEGSARIPLMIHAPRRYAAKRVSSPVSLVDVLPTLTDLAGTSDSVRRRDGTSLVGHCEGSSNDETTVFGEYLAEGAIAPIVMIRRGRWKFIHSPADPDQLFDLTNDPREVHNLAGDPEAGDLVQELRAEVAERWDLTSLHASVIENQQARMLVTKALRSGQFTSWEWTPPRNASNEYMRNHLDLNDVERLARWPR